MDTKGVIGKYESFICYEDRLSSFDTWSSQIIPDRYQLAKAGYFYSGFGDKVVCFSCDLKLYNWEKTDDPWIEHYKNSPDCLFLKLVGYKTESCEPMDVIPNFTSSSSITQFVSPPAKSLEERNPLFRIFASDPK